MKKSIKYTDSASKKLNSVLEKVKEQIADDIVNSKNYPGEELIEITASDIEETYRRLSIRNNKSTFYRKSKMIRMIIPVYFILGIMLTLFGIFRKDIMELIKNDKEGLMYSLTGFVISLTSAAIFYLYKNKENERRREYEKERRNLSKWISEIDLEKYDTEFLKDENASA
ncbi:hypothetical protein [Kordia sp.]|uniref:hypothetical protein n=1 Tax=Kordia sp. TaxID=1965332 RepID=UPI003D2B6318